MTLKKQLVVYKRYLNMDLPKGQSAFLWGARKTGKSSYLQMKYPDAIYYDLLKTDEYMRLLKHPSELRHEVLALTPTQLKDPIIIDEVQKIPQLLDEIHWLIENTEAYFILCGSSARKLKREGVNLLGGRAWRYEFYPLVYPEIPDFDLLHALNHGLVPSHYLTSNFNKSIQSYINDYLKEEIKEEGLTRNLAAFAEFVDIAAFSNGEQINYANVARDCGIDAKTIKEYYQILVDTLLGHFILPYKNKLKRDDLVATPKFYFFDVGLVNGITQQNIAQLKGSVAGSALEHYILMELIAYRGLLDKSFNITYWRTKKGQEVDFILGNAEIALEIKISDKIHLSDIKGLLSFQADYKPQKSIVVCNAPKKQKRQLESGEIDIYPWSEFLSDLWAGEIL